MIANWVKQLTATTGTGAITLGDNVSRFISVGDAFSDGDELHYTIEDGNNRESGIGTYTASGTTLSRDTVIETLVNGTFDNTSPTAITLSGNAVVSVSGTTHSLLSHLPVWKDNIVPFHASRLAGIDEPDLETFQGDINAFAFDASVVEEVLLSFHIDHDYAPGTKVYPHIHWSPSDTGTGTVRWGIEYTFAARDTGAFGSTTTVYLEQAGSGTAFKHQVVEFGDSDAFVITAPGVDSVVMMRVFRDATHANDTYTSDAFGLFVDLHYQASFIGTPNKASDFYAW